MFDFFRFKKNVEGNKTTNVVPFPEPKAIPYVEPPEKPATVFYRLGLTDNNRVSLQMGYGEITMNAAGVDNLIKQLQVFRDQLGEQEDDLPEPTDNQSMER